MAKKSAKKAKKARKAAPAAGKAKALSLHLGLNAVDPAHYEGWDGKLSACEFDARDMAELARSRRRLAPRPLLQKRPWRR